MLTNPSIQTKAQQIVDDFYGHEERLPDIADRERGELVYVEAVIMEVYRYVLCVLISPFSVLSFEFSEVWSRSHAQLMTDVVYYMIHPDGRQFSLYVSTASVYNFHQ